MATEPEANPKKLLSIVSDVYNGKVVIPVFQRSFVWTRNDVKEFLTSLLQGYFIGTFLILDTTASQPMFPFKPVEGVENVNPKVNSKEQRTVQLVLDGQQRITSLFYALYEPDIPLKGVKNSYRFYLNLDEALNGDIDEAVVGISKRDKKQTNEWEQRCNDHRAIRFKLLQEDSNFFDWLYQEQSVWSKKQNAQIRELYKRLNDFQVPVVALPEETSKDDLVNIFERINRTGVSLSLFDLAVAHLYTKDIKLRELWERFCKKYKAVSSIVEPIFLLRVIALLQGKEIRKRNLLDAINLEKKDFKKCWDEAVDSMVKAHKRITEEYGAFDDKWIAYTLVLVTLAVFLHKLREKSAGAEDYQKVDRWYWTCVLSRRYDSSAFTKTFQDVRDLEKCIDGEADEPQWLQQFAAQDLNLDSVNESRSALYRGIMGFIISQGGTRDFLTGQSVKYNECQDDHIFPKSVYKKKYGKRLDTILNRTLIWNHTNNSKKNKHPSEFFEECLLSHGGDEAKLLETLRSHFISREAYEALKQDNFDAFIAERRKAIKTEVEIVLRR